MAKKKMTLEEKLEEAIVKDVSYEMPKNWAMIRLGYLGKWGSGGTPSRKHHEYYEGTIPWIKTGELNNDYIYDAEEKITEDAINNSSAKIFKKDSVLIAMYGATIGKVAILGIDATTNQACAAIECNKEIIDNKFIFYYLLSQKDNFIELGKGGAQPNISQMIIKEYKCPVPPLKEQQRIVDKIESLFEKLDKTKELIEEARDDFEKRKSASVYKIINQFGNDKIKLKDCIKFITDKKEPVDGDVYIGLENMGKAAGIINYSIAENVKSTKTKFNKGDILYGRLRPYLNKHDVADKSGICSTDILVMRANEKFEAKYIDYILGTLELIRYANENSSGINLPRVSAKVLGEYEIPNIEFNKQKEVVRTLNKIFEDENKIEELTQLEDQIELIKKSILAKAFRGQLGTNCEDDESAFELLKGILNT